MELVQIFCEYYSKHSDRTYEEFLLYLKKNYDGVGDITLVNIKLLKRKLQREKILICKKTNGVDGLFYSVKEINKQILKKKFNIEL